MLVLRLNIMLNGYSYWLIICLLGERTEGEWTEGGSLAYLVPESSLVTFILRQIRYRQWPSRDSAFSRVVWQMLSKVIGPYL